MDTIDAASPAGHGTECPYTCTVGAGVLPAQQRHLRQQQQRSCITTVSSSFVDSSSHRGLPACDTNRIRTIHMTPTTFVLYMIISAVLLSCTTMHSCHAQENNPQQGGGTLDIDQQISVIEGGEIVLPCNLAITDILLWRKDNGDILFNGGQAWSDTSSRYSLIDDNGRYDMAIRDAERADDAVYVCQSSSHSYNVRLVILVIPGQPFITLDTQDPPQEDQTVAMTCTTSGGNPPPTLRWYRNDVPVPNNQDVQYRPAEEKFGETVSVLRRRLTKDDHGREYRCDAENEATREGQVVRGNRILDVHYAPRVTFNHPSPYHVVETYNVSIICQVDSNPPNPRISWTSEDGEYNYSPVTGEYSNLLHFERVDASRSGGYRCTAENEVNSTSEIIHIDVQYSPRVTLMVNGEVSAGSKTYNENETVRMQCVVDANPPPDAPVQWTHDGDVIPSSHGSTHDVLEYSPLLREHDGFYMCSAVNTYAPSDITMAVGSTNQGAATVTLNVQYRPADARISGPTQFIKGERGKLRCSVPDRGSPPAVLRWYRASAPSQLIYTGSELDFGNMTLADDDQYICRPTNDVGDGAAGTYVVRVDEKPEFVELDGRMGLPPRHVINVTDSDVTLTCSARGRPRPDIRWVKDGDVITTASNHGNSQAAASTVYQIVEEQRAVDAVSTVVTSTLRFRGAGRVGYSRPRIDDAGVYACMVTNELFTTATTSTTEVVVHYPPVLNVSAEKIAIDIEDDPAATLECTAQSEPEASFEWYKDSQLLAGNDGKIFIQTEPLTHLSRPAFYISRLNITRLTSSDLGRYQCLGRNLLGSNSATIELLVKTIPDAPRNLHTISRTWESIELSWAAGFDGGYSQSYIATYTSTSRPGGRVNITPRDTNTFNITGLYPASNYTFTLAAINRLGVGPQSLSLTTYTYGFTIDPPTEVYYEEETSTLSFRSPSTNYCVNIELYEGNAWRTYRGCESALGGSVQITGYGELEAVRAKLCLKRRELICSEPASAIMLEPPSKDLSVETIIIVACVCGSIVIILTIILIVLCCKRYKTTQKDQEADASRPTNPVFATEASSNALNNRPSSPVKPQITGIDNPALDYTSFTQLDGHSTDHTTTTTTTTTTNNHIAMDYGSHRPTINSPQLTIESDYVTYSNKNGGYGNGYTSSNGHLPHDPPPKYGDIDMERNPIRSSARPDKLNNNLRSSSNASDVYSIPKKRQSDMIPMEASGGSNTHPHNSYTHLAPARTTNPDHHPHGNSDSGVSTPDPATTVKPKKVIYEVIV